MERKSSMVIKKGTKWEMCSLRNVKVQLSLVRRRKCYRVRLLARPKVDILHACLVP